VVGTASELASLEGLNGTLDEYGMSAILRRYGFEAKSIRKDGSPKYRYVLDAGRLANLLKRFGWAKAAKPLQPTTGPTTG